MAEATIFDQLAAALRKRVEIIADHEWRERDAAAHLGALKAVSEGIAELQPQLPSNTSPTLLHYLQRCSYTKALLYLEDPENKQPAHR